MKRHQSSPKYCSKSKFTSSQVQLKSPDVFFLRPLYRGCIKSVSFKQVKNRGWYLWFSLRLVWILFHCEEFLCGVRSVSFITCLCYWWGAAGLHLGPNFVCIIYAPSSLHFWVSQGPISHLYPVVHVNQFWVYVLIRLACLRKLHKKLDGWYIFFS